MYLSASARPPRAKTSRQASAVLGSERSSPSPRAMSAIERNMMVVEKGSSTGRLEKPNAPAAPAKTARLLCIRRLSRSGFPARLRSEKLSPLLMAASAALFAISEMLAGMIDPMALTCRPMIALKRIARLVCSSSRMARASTAWSSNESSDVSLGAFASREEDNGKRLQVWLIRLLGRSKAGEWFHRRA
jgi:hypothetical protein